MSLLRAVLWSVSLAVLTSTLSASGLELTITSDRVEARGVTPGGATVWLQVAHLYRGFTSGLDRSSVIRQDSDRDGVEVFQPEGGVPLRSIWAVVDLATGACAVASPEGSGAEILAMPENLLHSDSPGQVKKLIRRSRFMELLVVRPGQAAWERSAGDGGASDEDKASNGSVSVSIDRFTPVDGSSAAPTHFRNGDVLVAVDPYTMQAYALTVGGAK